MSTLAFSYRGHDFSLYLVPYEEAPAKKKRIQETLQGFFDKYSEKLSLGRIREGRSIDWSYLLKTESESEKREMFNLLEALSVLSFDRRSNWEIVSDLAPLNPRHPTSGLLCYFTTKEGAIAYAAAEYRDTAYDWWIVRYTEVISKSQAMRQ